MRATTTLRLEQLETRLSPATYVNATTVTYRDVDGDNVTIMLSKQVLTDGNASSVFLFDSPFATTGPQQLQQINLTALDPAKVKGTNVTVKAVRSPANGGDGFANVGYVNATGIDLGTVTIRGDLGRINAGDADPTSTALGSLAAQSMGRFGLTTQAAGGVLEGRVTGKLGALNVKSDVLGVDFRVLGGMDGKIGSIFIGGSLIGGGISFSGRIGADSDIGTVTIQGDIVGGTGLAAGGVSANNNLGSAKIGGSIRGGSGSEIWSGFLFALDNLGPVTVRGEVVGGAAPLSGLIQAANGKLASVTIGGSVIGGSGKQSGFITSSLNMGQVKIGGDLQGGGGEESGAVKSGSGSVAGVTIGGALRGGTGDRSGYISSKGAMGAVKITGDLAGGSGPSSGVLFTFDKLAGVTIGGSLRGGTGHNSGSVTGSTALGPVAINGDFVGGSASGSADLLGSGFIFSPRIASVTLGGSFVAGVDNTTGFFLNNGAIRSDSELGPVLIKGSIIGNATNPAIISAMGSAAPTATSDVAIKSLSVLGRVEFAKILAGVSQFGLGSNNDAQIGAVTVGGDWIASSIAAGAHPGGDGQYGNDNDTRFTDSGFKDVAGLSSRIASVTIGGQILGTLADVNNTDHFGIVAEQIGAVRIGGTALVLTTGLDNLAIGATNDFRVREI